MTKNPGTSSPYPPQKNGAANPWMRFAMVLILSIGLIFRVANLDHKPVWSDETHTFSVISGFSDSEAFQELPTGTPIPVVDFLQNRYPNSHKGLEDSLEKLYTDVHPPLYFLTARWWVNQFGHSVASLRRFSAFTSVLALPAMYWFCWELYQSSGVGWLATLLLAVSPIHIIYAAEARPYSLFSLTVLLASASLLWAWRTGKKLPWLIYTICSALGLYSQIFFLFVVFGYGVYITVIEKFKISRKWLSFVIATSGSFLLFSPWILTLYLNFHHFQEKSGWISQQGLTLLGAGRWWFHNLSLAFVDPGASHYWHLNPFSFYFLIPPILVLIGYCGYLLCQNTAKNVYFFIFTLIGSTALPLIMADLMMGGNRQTWPRYLFPCFLGIQVVVAYGLFHSITGVERQMRWRRQAGRIIIVALITMGIIFSGNFVQAQIWWNKYGGGVIASTAAAINHADQPLVIVNQDSPETLVYYGLDPTVNLFILETDHPPWIALEGKTIFLLNPTENLKQNFAQAGMAVERVHQYFHSGAAAGEVTELWRLTSSLPPLDGIKIPPMR